MRNSEVTNLHGAFVVKQQVFQLDISVQNLIAMTVFKSFSDLLKQKLGKCFIELLASANETEQVTPSTKLHNEAQVAFSLERIVQLNDILMVRQML